MYPAKFRYEAPRTLDEALDLLRSYGDEAKVLAGGQSLIPMMKLRFATPELLVDINGLPDLAHHQVHDGALEVGALCRHVHLEFSGGRGAADRRPRRAEPGHARRVRVPCGPAG